MLARSDASHRSGRKGLDLLFLPAGPSELGSVMAPGNDGYADQPRRHRRGRHPKAFRCQIAEPHAEPAPT